MRLMHPAHNREIVRFESRPGPPNEDDNMLINAILLTLVIIPIVLSIVGVALVVFFIRAVKADACGDDEHLL